MLIERMSSLKSVESSSPVEKKNKKPTQTIDYSVRWIKLSYNLAIFCYHSKNGLPLSPKVTAHTNGKLSIIMTPLQNLLLVSLKVSVQRQQYFYSLTYLPIHSSKIYWAPTTGTGTIIQLFPTQVLFSYCFIIIRIPPNFGGIKSSQPLIDCWITKLLENEPICRVYRHYFIAFCFALSF